MDSAAARLAHIIIYYVSTVLLHYQASIATIFGLLVGHDLAMRPEEVLSQFICLMSLIWIILFLISKFGYNIPPYLRNFIRLRLLPSFSLMVTVALLTNLPMMMYSHKMEMEAAYIVQILCKYNPLMRLFFPFCSRVFKCFP